MLIAQITDLHIRPENTLAYNRVPTNEMVRTCIADILSLDRRPDVILVSGDVTDCGLVEEYQAAVGLLNRFDMPVYVIPGNHDRRDNFRRMFSDYHYLPASGNFVHYVIDEFPVRLIGLDTVVPGFGHGELCSERLAWLDARLTEDGGKPTIIFMHHPPFLTGIHHMDRINCRNGVEMARIVRRHANVERVLAGHHHRPIQVRWAGTVGSIAPSPAHQVMLDFGTLRDDAKIIMEPPAYQLHLWDERAGLVSHLAYVGEFPGPFDFVLDPEYPAYETA